MADASAGIRHTLPELPIQYADMQSGNANGSRENCSKTARLLKEQLAGAPDLLSCLPTGLGQHPKLPRRGGICDFARATREGTEVFKPAGRRDLFHDAADGFNILAQPYSRQTGHTGRVADSPADADRTEG